MGHQDQMDGPERLVSKDAQAKMDRMAWISVQRLLYPFSLASFALKVHAGIEAPRETSALLDREENLAIMESLAVMASRDRRDPPGNQVNGEPRANPAKGAHLVTMQSEDQELLDLGDLTAPADRKGHLEPED